MTVVIFCGPTLHGAAPTTSVPEAVFLPPAECGDVYLACRRHPRAIVLIDGYFDHRLSVWHKELLWALSRGIRLYGAASMGALRAAELGPHGMIGVGEIHGWYRSGEIEDDDEVAVLHEPKERGYKPRSDAMVNIRATLHAARRCNVVDYAGEAAVIAAGKAMFYADRSFQAAVAAAELPDHERSELYRWFEREGLVDQKRADATALMERVAADLAQPDRSPVARPNFVPTCYWDALRRNFDGARVRAAVERPPEPSEPEPSEPEREPPWEHAERLLNRATAGAASDLRMEVELAAAERALAVVIAERAGYQVTSEQEQAASDLIRQEQGALTPPETAAWLSANHMTLADFSALAREEVLMDRFAEQARTLAAQQVPSVLRLLGLFESTVQNE